MDDVLAAAFRRHYTQIYGYIRRTGSSHADAEEITQEVFAQAAANLERLKADSRPLAGWLFTVAQRRLADQGRHRARAARLSAVVDHTEATLPRYGPEVASALRRALDELPEPQRRVVVLKLLEGRPFVEIARLLGTTETASRMRFSRALEHLRDELEKEGIAP